MCTIWSICLSEADIYAIYAYLCVQPELACTLLSGVEVMEVFMNASYGIYASLNPINKSSGFSWTIQTFQTYHVGNIVGDLILWWYNIYLIYNIYNIYIYIIYVVILYNIWYIYIIYFIIYQRSVSPVRPKSPPAFLKAYHSLFDEFDEDLWHWPVLQIMWFMWLNDWGFEIDYFIVIISTPCHDSR